MFMTKRPFATAKQCPVVGHAVALSGLQLRLADGTTELVKKTCVKFADCYQNPAGARATGNIVPLKGCLLGDSEI
jgi:hypothetical protein